jgi:hypothetical protein
MSPAHSSSGAQTWHVAPSRATGRRAGRHARSEDPAPLPRFAGDDPNGVLEGMLRLAASRQGDLAELVPAVLAASLLVYTPGGSDTEVYGFPERGGGRVVVCACTSRRFVPQAWPATREILGAELATELGEHPLLLNPTGGAGVLIPAELLRAGSTG